MFLSGVWGVCNPSGLSSKGHLLCRSVDVWMACETHLSVASFRRFRGELRSCASPFKWCIPGAHVPCRSTVSDIGAWSGVAVLSQWPSRALPFDWSQAVHASSRLVCTTTFLHGLWVSGITLYGTPTGPTHPHAKATTNELLKLAVNRIAQSHGPRYVCGDWNHDLDSLEAVDMLRTLGFEEVQQLHYQRTGIPAKPTCKLKTQRDFLFISAELQDLFQECEVHHDMWPDHSPVIARFRGGHLELRRTPWPVHFQIPWEKLGRRGDGERVDFSSPSDPTDQYKLLWQDVEKQAQACAVSSGQPLGVTSLGRGQRTEPTTLVAASPRWFKDVKVTVNPLLWLFVATCPYVSAGSTSSKLSSPVCCGLPYCVTS